MKRDYQGDIDSQIKTIRTKFRQVGDSTVKCVCMDVHTYIHIYMYIFLWFQSVNSGKRSGHRRVIYLYYDLCEKVWGGSPATEQMETGLESIDLTASMPEPNNTSLENKEVDENVDEEREQSNDHQPYDELPDNSESSDQLVSNSASHPLEE